MKKIFSGIICFCIFISTFGCNISHVKQSSELKEFDIEKAFQVVNQYMVANMKNDVNEMEKFYSSAFKKDNSTKPQQDVIINGYRFDEVNQAQSMADINVRVTKINTKIPYASLEIQDFKVIKEKNDYKIKSIDIENQNESFETYANNNNQNTSNGSNNNQNMLNGSNNNQNALSGRQIRVRLRNNVKTNLVTNFQGIPKYYYTQDDKARITKIPVTLGQFGVTAFAYGGTIEAITTKGDNPFIEIVHFDESMATQGGTGGSDSGGGGSSSGGGTAGGGVNQAQPETPISKDIMPIDIIPGAVINNMVFSQDERYLAIQYSKPNLGNSIRIYLNKNGKIISFQFEKNYPMDKVDVKIINFVEDGLIYNVEPRDGKANDNSIKNIIGTWQIDMKKYKPKRINENEISKLKK